MTRTHQIDIDQEDKNLNELAKELALNYFHNCSIDFVPNQYNGDLDELKKLEIEVFKKKVFESKKLNDNYACRNILVIGAGATHNAFRNIPLAEKAISDIQKEIVVAKVFDKYAKDENPEKLLNLNFDYFIKFYQLLHPEIPQAFKFEKNLQNQFKHEILNTYIVKALGIDVVNHKVNLKALINEEEFDLQKHKKNDAIKTEEITTLVELGKKYFSLYENLNLYASQKNQTKPESNDNLKEYHIDFETSLYLLSEIFSAATIRMLIQNVYNLRYGPTLFYQIVAHLFKNGFIDVIINFNFDELLDQAIDDEIDKDGYDLIVSDGDCIAFNEISDDNRLRQPLYIKPHGTASHKSSLRFTKNHYQELPQDMRSFLEEVVAARTKNGPQLRVNLITVGFGMRSLEFNHIIDNNLPDRSKIFHFYHYRGEEPKLGSYLKHNRKFIKGLFKNWGDRHLKLRQLSHQFYTSSEEIPVLKKEMTTLGNTFYKLHGFIQKYYKPVFQPSNIHRHLIIAKIFGNQKFWRTCQGLSDEPGRTNYPKDYFETEQYFKDMVLIEILINLVANNGMLDPTLLMRGNTGVYYSLFFKQEKEKLEREKVEKPDEEDTAPTSLADLINNFNPRITTTDGQNEKDGNESINPLKITDFNIDLEDNFNTIRNRLFENNAFFSEELKTYLTGCSKKLKDSIKSDLLAIKNSNNSKIQPKLRSAVHHTFSDYNWGDLITNNLSNHLHYQKGIIGTNELPINMICIIADYAHQLKHFMPVIERQRSIKDVYVILAYPKYSDIYDTKNIKSADKEENEEETEREQLESKALNRLTEGVSKELRIELKDKIHIRFRPIKRHNHHMTIFMNYDKNLNFEEHYKEKVSKVIYYYKKGLSESINPIRIKEKDNIKHLLEKFKYYSDRAKDEFPHYKEKLEKKDDKKWANITKEIVRLS